ncbi:MAG: hypothetical protein HC868_16560 [Sphingomonadales bacterium]|nr:hypothetical protein [Sphingomonadales bacterium]
MIAKLGSRRRFWRAASGFLGYKMVGWWAPAAVACAVLAVQAISYQGVISTSGSVSGFVQLLAMGALMSLIMFYATFSMGRSLGLRRRRMPR